MARQESVVSLDPIDRRRQRDTPISRLFKTRHFGGKAVELTDAFGHYLFVGKQRQGKSVSMVWYAEMLKKKYEKKGKKVILLSNMGIGVPFNRSQLFELFSRIEYDSKKVYIFLIDEIQSWFPKDTKDKITLELIDKLTGEFSQLGKRQMYVLSTAQVYGRLNKNLREQCLYMVNNKRTIFTNRIKSEFIDGDDVICDDLGRWAGVPKKIYVHGLAKDIAFDTHTRISIS